MVYDINNVSLIEDTDMKISGKKGKIYSSDLWNINKKL